MPAAPMGSSSDSTRVHGISVLRSAALTLFGVFTVSVILRLLPPRLLDPLWQVSLTTALLDMGGYALLGVAVLTLAQLLAPEDEQLERQLGRIWRGCGLAGLGYLLLVPLLLSALLRDFQQVERLSARQQRDIERQDVRLQQAVRSARDRDELLNTVQRINAPALGSFLISEAPLEQQRARALELLRSTAATARRQAGAVGPGTLKSVLLNNLRLLGLALVFAFGFASAHAGAPAFPLLQPLRRLARLRMKQRASLLDQEHDYFDSLSRQGRSSQTGRRQADPDKRREP